MTNDKLFVKEPSEKSVRKRFLKSLCSDSSFDLQELELFEWYVKETEGVAEHMLQAVHEDLDEQERAGIEVPNDSGIITLEYYMRRIRYSHVIYLASLLEVFLEHECGRLKKTLEPADIFEPKDLKGDKWSTKRKFLEVYGQFRIPDTIWNGAATVTGLRNNLVHDNGAVAEIPTNVRRALEDAPGVRLPVAGEVTIEPGFIWYGYERIKELAHYVENKVTVVVSRAIRPGLV